MVRVGRRAPPQTGRELTGSLWEHHIVRADRLLAVLLMLQNRGQVTAAEVATELEVSERTARRDLEALSTAGVPVYSRQGRNGGWQLLGGARTDLSGLTSAEARALFLVAGPSSAATPEIKAALRKLIRALPETFRSEAEAASSAIIVDHAGWGRATTNRPAPPFLDALQRAVIDGAQVRFCYRKPDGLESERVVHPLGLAAKGLAWYLIAQTDAGQRTFRVDRVTGVEPTGEPVVRPRGFDLESAWRTVSEHVDRQMSSLTARALVAPEQLDLVRMVLGRRMRIGHALDDGRVQVEVAGPSVEALAGELAGLGAMIEILDPPEVRQRLADVADELHRLYGPNDARPSRTHA
jgi:predicted DNA-binding transcriptional regulator YafY